MVFEINLICHSQLVAESEVPSESRDMFFGTMKLLD